MAQQTLVPGWSWYIDKQRLFFGMQQMRRADLGSFRPLNEWWGLDANRVYCAGSEMRDADPKTFTVLNSLYAKDARQAYTIKGPIPDVEDTSTFQAVGPTEHPFNAENGYAKDSQHVYHTTLGGKASVVKGADPTTFRALGRGYGADKSTLFFERKKVPSADPETWEHIRGPHSRDAENAYFLGRRIPGADLNSLESLPFLGMTGYWSRDDNGYFNQEKSAEPEEYFREFRCGFIFRGEVVQVKLSYVDGSDRVPLDPTRSDSWAIAQHARIDVDCKEWIQKPDINITEFPPPGQPFKIGQALRLRDLAEGNWMKEERIWILTPRQDHTQRAKRMLLGSTDHWWEYSQLDQLDAIQKTMAHARW
jgi:hypothetical protein